MCVNKIVMPVKKYDKSDNTKFETSSNIWIAKPPSTTVIDAIDKLYCYLQVRNFMVYCYSSKQQVQFLFYSVC